MDSSDTSSTQAIVCNGIDSNPVLEEDKATKRARRRSLWIAQCALCIFSLGFSVILTGVYPYMKQLLPDIEDEDELLTKYGWVVAVNPLGQMIFGPVAGWVGNKLKSVRVVCLCCCVLYITGNVIYCLLSLFLEDNRYAMLLVARFIVGIASSNVAPLRSYIALATYESERTFHMSIAAGAQSMGFVAGPIMQALLTPIQCSEKSFDPSLDRYVAWDMYTAAGWVSVGLGCLSIICFLPGVFTEFDVATAEREALKQKSVEIRAETDGGVTTMREGEGNATNASQLGRPDMIVMSTLLLNFGIYVFNFTLIETLGTPMVMDEFGWTESEAIKYMGISLAAVAAIATVSYATIGKMSQRIDERKILIYWGILPMLIGRLLMMPFPGDHPEVAEDDEEDPAELTSWLLSIFRLLPWSQGSYRNVDCSDEEGPPLCGHDWCDDQPAISMAQFYISFFVGFFGYAYCVALTQALYSKAIGPRPQGNWMGALTASGSMGRILGPLAVPALYNNFGLYATAAAVSALMIITLITTLLTYRRLVAFSVVATAGVTEQRRQEQQWQENGIDNKGHIGDEETPTKIEPTAS